MVAAIRLVLFLHMVILVMNLLLMFSLIALESTLLRAACNKKKFRFSELDINVCPQFLRYKTHFELQYFVKVVYSHLNALIELMASLSDLLIHNYDYVGSSSAS